VPAPAHRPDVRSAGKRYHFGWGSLSKKLAKELAAETIIPIHYEGWKHFRQGRDEAEREFAQEGVADRVRWLPIGVAETILI
jgi:hypothetical protein